jgi:hypothetical protein
MYSELIIRRAPFILFFSLARKNMPEYPQGE